MNGRYSMGGFARGVADALCCGDEGDGEDGEDEDEDEDDVKLNGCGRIRRRCVKREIEPNWLYSISLVRVVPVSISIYNIYIV